ncbi:hypothetical protein [Chryseobacterium indoltheticum]|uniref:hypothetical protein n=1 Tax=Chryseobacterium indoltheticum TaxID=254 RepID=UPI003F4995C6
MSEVPNVTVINIRTDEQVLTNRDGHFMISGRQGDILRLKPDLKEQTEKFLKENVESPMNVKLVRSCRINC